MKHLKTLLITCYFLTLATLLSVKIVETVFSGSVLIGEGDKMADLRGQKKSLLSERQKLEQKLVKADSLTEVDETQLAAYTPISNPIIIEVSNSVASR